MDNNGNDLDLHCFQNRAENIEEKKLKKTVSFL